MLPRSINTISTVLVISLALSCSEKEKVRLNDQEFLKCVREDDQLREAWIFFDTLQVILESRGIDVTNPDSRKFYEILKHRQAAQERTKGKFEVDLTALCRCRNVHAYEHPAFISRTLKCLTNGMSREKSSPVVAAMLGYMQFDNIEVPEELIDQFPSKKTIREINEQQIRDFIDNYEDGAGKTFVLTFLIYTTFLDYTDF